MSIWIGVIVSAALQAGKGVHADLADPAVFMPLLGASVYVTLLALLAFGIGLLVRSSAGGIAITLGLLLVLPVVLSLIANVIQRSGSSTSRSSCPTRPGRSCSPTRPRTPSSRRAWC